MKKHSDLLHPRPLKPPHTFSANLSLSPLSVCVCAQVFCSCEVLTSSSWISWCLTQESCELGEMTWKFLQGRRWSILYGFIHSVHHPTIYETDQQMWQRGADPVNVNHQCVLHFYGWNCVLMVMNWGSCCHVRRMCKPEKWWLVETHTNPERGGGKSWLISIAGKYKKMWFVSFHKLRIYFT